MNWYARHRQEWIAETLRVFGFINRKHIERKFGVSTPQASMDIQAFMQAHPGWVSYDKSAKCYFTTGESDDQKKIPGPGPAAARSLSPEG